MTNSSQNSQTFTEETSPSQPRLRVIKLSKGITENFKNATKKFNVQSIEYKPFLRFHIANTLNELAHNKLGSLLLDNLHNRSTGAILLECEGASDEDTKSEDFIDFNILLSTAVSHLIGMPNLDSMSGKFYARFSVKNDDNSDSYLRQAHRRMELHNDGTYVQEKTDWVLMQKSIESNVEGGESLLLHLDDWTDLQKFYEHPLAKENLQ